MFTVVTILYLEVTTNAWRNQKITFLFKYNKNIIIIIMRCEMSFVLHTEAIKSKWKKISYILVCIKNTNSKHIYTLTVIVIISLVDLICFVYLFPLNILFFKFLQKRSHYQCFYKNSFQNKYLCILLMEIL